MEKKLCVHYSSTFKMGSQMSKKKEGETAKSVLSALIFDQSLFKDLQLLLMVLYKTDLYKLSKNINTFLNPF